MNNVVLRFKAISLFSDAAREVEPLAALLSCSNEERVVFAAKVFRAVAQSGCESTGEWIDGLLRRDDNPFSRLCAKRLHVPPRIKHQAENELAVFKALSLVTAQSGDPETDSAVADFGVGGMNCTYEKLVSFYQKSGCGVLAASSAFVYGDGFIPVAPERIRLSDLKNYAEEKAEIVRNTENFIAGLPAFHTLLYGDRGTGKSSTVRALAYEYRDRLKVVELPKDRLGELPKIFMSLDGLAQKYIVFVDDLSFDENDGDAQAFKAALEGSLLCGNALVYCTSNRRHLFRESEKTTRRNDDVQAELALFDRFGLVVTYVDPDRAEFIDILKQIILSRGMKWREEYAQIAELAALKKGGRSPRAAKQIADVIESTYVGTEKA